MSARTKPPPLPADENLAVEVVTTVVRLLWRILVYWLRCMRHRPLMGLLYVATVPWALWVAGSHLGPLFPPLGRKVPTTLTSTMIQSGELLLACTILIILVIGLDRRLVARPAQVVATVLPPVPHDLVLLGQRIERTWDKHQNNFSQCPTTIPLTLTETELRTSVAICAITGQGKSRGFLDEFLGWTERTHNNCQWIDPKGDDANRARFTHVFDLGHLDQSFLWDLYGDLTPTQAGEALGEALFTGVPGMDTAGEYFNEVAKEAMRAIFVAHAAADAITLPDKTRIQGRCPTPTQLYDYVANPKLLKGLINILPPKSTAGLDLNHVITLSDSGNDALGQIFNKIGPLARSDVAPYLVSGAPGISIRELVNTPGARVLWALDTGLQRRMSTILGRLVVSLWTYAILDRSVRKDYMKLLLADEASVFAGTCADLPTGMVTCRSHNAGYVLAFQNLKQLGMLGGMIWDSSGTKIMMGMTPAQSADLFSQEVGEQEYPFIGTSHSENIGRGGGNNASGGLIGGNSGTSRNRSSGRSSGSSESIQRRRTWLTAELQNLPPFHAVVLVNRFMVDLTKPGGGERDIALIRLDQNEPALAAQRVGQRRQAQQIARHLSKPPTTPAKRGTIQTVKQCRELVRTGSAAWQELAPLTADSAPEEQAYRQDLDQALTLAIAWYAYYTQKAAQEPPSPLRPLPIAPAKKSKKDPPPPQQSTTAPVVADAAHAAGRPDDPPAVSPHPTNAPGPPIPDLLDLVPQPDNSSGPPSNGHPPPIYALQETRDSTATPAVTPVSWGQDTFTDRSETLGDDPTDLLAEEMPGRNEAPTVKPWTSPEERRQQGASRSIGRNRNRRINTTKSLKNDNP